MCVDPYEPHTNGGFVREEGYRVADDALLYFKSAVRGQNLLRFLFHAGDYQAGFAEDRLLDRCFQFFHVGELKVVPCYNSFKLYVCCVHHIDCFKFVTNNFIFQSLPSRHVWAGYP